MLSQPFAQLRFHCHRTVWRCIAGPCFSLVLGVLLGVLFAAAARAAGDVPDPDPELERQTFQMPAGWEINLFASDPMIPKPIQMNFDPAGRLWVATSATYPQIKPGQKADDKIIVLEDTDHDGRADKATTFADGLLIPTGVAPGDGGAYVANSTEVLHMRDTDGDGRADATRVLLSGFGTEDTHHILHAFRWGPEGLLYFNQSVYIHSHIETPWGIRRLMAGGIWRLRPETMQLEVFARGWWNAWGHQFDAWGQSFVTDGAGGEGINFVLPDAYYAAAYEPPSILPGLNPGQPKLCSHEVLSGRHVPPEWIGSIVTNDFRGHRIARFALSDNGSGFASTRVDDLLASNHVAFRPVDIKLGPDGALYIADFYNPIINHGEVDFRDPRRDLTHGRIWRMSYKPRPLVAVRRFDDAPLADLLDALKEPEAYSRDMAKRVLKSRAPGVVAPVLAEWVAQLDRADPGFEHHRLEALWVYQALDVVEPELLRAVSTSPDFHARAAAARVLYHWGRRVNGSPDVYALLAAAVADEQPRVRLEALATLRQLRDARAAELALRALDRPLDPFLDYALSQTIRELQPAWLPEFMAGHLAFDNNQDHVTYALRSAGKREVAPALVELLLQGKISPDAQANVLATIVLLGGARELEVVFDRALTLTEGDRQQQAALLDMLRKAAAERSTRPTGDLARVIPLFAVADAAVAQAALRLAGSWKLEPARGALIAAVAKADSPLDVRAAAMEGLAHLSGPGAKESLAEVAKSPQPMSVRMIAAAALAPLDISLAAQQTVEMLAAAPADAAAPENELANLFDSLLRSKQGPQVLAAALKGKSMPAPIAAIGLRRASSSGRDMKELMESLVAAGGLTPLAGQLSPEAIAQLVAEITRAGSAERGEAIYRRAALQCQVCHSIAGAGGKVGPDLVSLGASAPLDYLIESITDPSKKIKENYNTTLINTNDGLTLTGLLVRKTEKELVLRDNTGKEVVVPLADVESQTASPNSLMPAGLANSLRRDELVDLVRFLSELGKEGPYQTPKAQFVRTWTTLDATKRNWRDLDVGATTFVPSPDNAALQWAPIYSNVAGELPLTELPELQRGKGHFISCVCFSLEAPASGGLQLKVDDSNGLEMWADGASIAPAAAMKLPLTPGPHRFAVAIDRSKRKTPLRIEVVGPTDAPR